MERIQISEIGKQGWSSTLKPHEQGELNSVGQPNELTLLFLIPLGS